MKHLSILFIFMTSFLQAAELYYQHPLPDSRYHSPQTTIILRFDSDPPVQPADIQYTVSGSISSTHSGEAVMATDEKTIIWSSATFFSAGESVQVELDIPKVNYSHAFVFHITGATAASMQTDVLQGQVIPSDTVRMLNGVALPSDFPSLKITQNAATDSGYIFINSNEYSLILKNDGTPVYYRKSGGSKLWDFTVQNDSTISLVEGATAKTFNQYYEPLEHYKGGHGYKTDHHEFVLTPEGHALLIMEDIQNIDLSAVVEGGKSNARVVANHIQELDKNKNVIFEWRSWDHYNIADADVALSASTIHVVHLNSIDIDYDGHLLVSARHQNEVTKINRNTGQVIWRLGGKNSTLSFNASADRFSYQHDFKAIDGKHQHYTVFDNGNNHDPQYSRAVEYYVDTMNNRVNKVWEYREQPDLYSNWMGSVKRLSNGNTGICWAHKNLPKYTEVTTAGEIVYELDFADKTTSYRAHRHVWHGRAKAPFLQAEPGSEVIRLIYNHFGETDITQYNVYGDTLAKPETLIATSSLPYINLSKITNYKTWYFRVTSVDGDGNESPLSNEVAVNVRLLLPDENQIKNGDFSDGLKNWDLTEEFETDMDWDINDLGELTLFIYQTSGYPSDVQLSQGELSLQQNKTYKLAFDAYADAPRPFEVQIMDDRGVINYSQFGVKQLSTRAKRFDMTFTMQHASNFGGRLFFNNGYSAGEIIIDNVYLAQIKDTGIENPATDEMLVFDLQANYPNPFNASTSIQYSLSQQTKVIISIYNILGERVHHREIFKAAGQHHYIWNAEQMSSGLYFCEMRAISKSSQDIFTDHIKIMLVK